MAVFFGIVVSRSGNRSICDLDMDYFSAALLATILGFFEGLV
jgi:hypothetical protein